MKALLWIQFDKLQIKFECTVAFNLFNESLPIKNNEIATEHNLLFSNLSVNGIYMYMYLL